MDIYSYNHRPDQNPKNSAESAEKYLADFWGKETVVLNSAHVGIYLALKFFGLSRPDHVLVPDFLCKIVLDIINESSFPVKYLDKKTRAILLFHQWGYPQDMAKVLPKAREHNLFIIEDCAHSFDSRYQDQQVGTFGDLAVFSFTKVLSTCTGGALISSNRDIISYAREERAKKDNILNKVYSDMVFYMARKIYEREVGYSWSDIVYLKSIFFPNISKKALRLLPADINGLKATLLKRKNNYLFIKNNIKREYLIPDWDDSIEVNPLCVPVFLPPERMKSVQEILRKKGIRVEILHFDTNRNMFDPCYRKCLATPCHQTVDGESLSIIVDAINN